MPKRKKPARGDEAGFPQFHKLPKRIKFMIWNYVAYFPRVVGIFEQHYDRREFDEGESEETCMVSKTRAPVVLHICKQARRHGMKVYTRIDQDVLRRSDSRCHPIYVNPEVDTIYRGKMSCRKGDFFNIRCKNFIWDNLPIAFTHTLAVDVLAVTRTRELRALPIRAFRKYSEKHGEGEELLESITEALRNTTYKEVEQCAEKGLRNIVFVVGNDEDKSEITLIPLEEGHLHGSTREKSAIAAVDRFRHDLAQFWAEKEVKHRLPNLKIMTVKRAPLETFSLFPQLPLELQLLVWKFAANVPRVTTFNLDLVNEKLVVPHNRPASLAHACSTSRGVSNKTITLPEIEDPLFHNNDLDVALLTGKYLDVRSFAKQGFKVIGVHIDDDITAGDVKTFVGLEKVFLLLGDIPSHWCETALEPIEGYTKFRYALPSSDQALVQLGERCVEYLREELRKSSTKWKSYQRRRKKMGKSSPDWDPPEVILAWMRPIPQTVSPYL